MKTYKSIEKFINNQKNEITWEDYMRIGGKVYKLYEYGGGSMFNMPYDYVYFVNKKTHNAIYIEYHCPVGTYKNGTHIITKPYKFIDAEFIPNMDLWRTDTL